MNPELANPVLLFTDFGNAFPSVLHEWLFIVAERSALPRGLIHLVRSIHSFCLAVGRAGSMVKLLFPILRGVIQGCPLAAFCFVLAFDPFLNWFDHIVVKKGLGVVRACTDDVGAALSSIKVLPTMASIFRFAHLLAGLAIKFKKCVLVPVGPWSADLAASTAAWARAHLAYWSAMSVAPSAKYLGTFLGTIVGPPL